MSSERHGLVADWFDRLTGLTATERGRALEELRATDAALAEVLVELLAEDGSRSRLDAPALATLAPVGVRAPASTPQVIGRYRILRRLGAGGMGAVYEAEQDQPRRRVALKVLRRGLLDSGALQRFEYEAEVLGWLQHPNIAQIYEAGSATIDGETQPFFAMELVRGAPLDEYAERAALSVRARIELVIALCDALEHAHRRGVVHRDLKPSNVLVDESGCPKVLDFGVARVTNANALASAPHTRAGELIGTPAYMSPEQIRADSSRVDARADVYALGVLAFELLSRRRLYDVASLPLHEAVRVVVEREAPRLGNLDRELRGDVETIVAKALEKDRDRRYPTAREFGADLRRALNDEPIAARPPTTIYQLEKFARRNRALVVGALSVLLALSAGLAVSLRMYLHAEAARAAEEQARLSAEDFAAGLHETTAYFLALLRAPMPDYDGIDVRVLEVLEKARPHIATAFASRPRQRARLLSTLSQAHHGLGDRETALRFARESLELTERWAPEDREGLVDALQQLAASAAQCGDLEQGLAAVERAASLLRASDIALRRATVHGTHSRILLALRRIDEAQEAAARTAIALDSDSTLDAVTAAPERLTIVQVLNAAGRRDEARAACLESIAAQEAESSEISYALVCCFDQMASMDYEQGRYDESAAWLRKSLDRLRELVGDEHPTIATHAANLAAALRESGRLDEAAPLLEEALTLARKHARPGDPGLAMKVGNHGLLLRARGDHEQAEALLRESLGLLESAGATGAPQHAYLLYQLGVTLIDRERYQEALAPLQESLELNLELFGPLRAEVASVAAALGRAQLEAGLAPDAVESLRLAQRTHSELGGEAGDPWIDVSCALAMALLEAGDAADALDVATRAHAALRAQSEPDPQLSTRCGAALGLGLRAHDRPDEADLWLSGAEAEHVRLFGEDHPLTVRLRLHLERGDR